MANSGAVIEEHIFGGFSTLYSHGEEGMAALQRVVAMSDELSYELSVLIFVVLYFIWIGRSLSQFDGVTFRISNPFAPISEVEGLGGVRRIGDILFDWSLVMVTLALFVSRLIDLGQLYYPPMVSFVVWITELGIWLWLLLVVAVMLVVRAWGWIVVRVMEMLMGIDPLGRGLITIKNRLLKMLTVWLMPLVVMSALEGDRFIIAYMAVAVSIIFVGIYLFRTLSLFVSEKISILHWILYLCTVEILPITLIWGLVVRQGSVM